MNIYDIAAEAKTSISTVSRVLNNKTNVNPEIKKRVEDILKKYDYKPSAIARGMVSKTMKSIAVLTADVRVSHYARIVHAIEHEFSKSGYNVNVCNTGNSRDECIKYININAEKQVDGIVLIGSIFNELINSEEIISTINNIPVVIANGHVDGSNFYSVMVDDKNAIRSAADYLYDKGYKDLLYVCDMDTASAKTKVNGFKESLKLRDILGVDQKIIKTIYGIEGGKEAADIIIDSGVKFDGVVFGEDITAIGAMKQFKKRGYKIPEDIAIIGCNNCQETLICEPELTTIDNKPELLGKLCAEILRNITEGKTPEKGISIQTEIIEREST
ncbi:LacI family DNA-binding transcriptional regulator [[Clostridium] fimetarium]|uniref:LacI family transcriptional regulator n=1 Tax=[Clostridium] fimetarium TaxID=99656 RepID=A0A1I0NRK4_9FIRM|nr:LacI family DNA-binding transcriptional regulator [[Clostridium] fimetarium]SEW04165.1 LacI family transcriptional regulator [[Clostridium] fimetarium]